MAVFFLACLNIKYTSLIIFILIYYMLLEPFAGKLSEAAETFNYRQFKEEQYDKLADHVRQHVNLPLIYKILTDNN